MKSLIAVCLVMVVASWMVPTVAGAEPAPAGPPAGKAAAPAQPAPPAPPPAEDDGPTRLHIIAGPGMDKPIIMQGGTGVVPDSKPPTTWDEKTGKSILWRAELPSWCDGRPVAVGNRVFVMNEPGSRTWSFRYSNATTPTLAHCCGARRSIHLTPSLTSRPRSGSR